MSKDLDTRSRGILTFRPNIDFVEPKQQPQQPNPVQKTPLVTDDAAEAEKIRQQLYNLAASIDVLATAVQLRIDLTAKDIKIKLDPKVDADAIAALKRQFDVPFTAKDGVGSDGFYITYDIYKQCRDNIRQYADDQAAKNTITKDQIDAARAKLPNTLVGGFGSTAAKDGTMRPELHVKAQLIEPLDIEKFQDYLIRILVNYIWLNFIRPPFAIIPLIGDAIPKKLCPIPSTFQQTLNSAKDKGVNVLG